MPSNNRVIIAAAGNGKTTKIVDQALSSTERTVLLTYTRNNVGEIESKLYAKSASIPPNVRITSWYSFLLHELVRPYRNVLYPHRIDSIAWIQGQSAFKVPEAQLARHYFAKPGMIYSDKLAKLICVLETVTHGKLLNRLVQRFDHIIIDEIQDMSGYDLEIIELLLRSKITLTMVGDHRQSTYSTSNSPKNSKFQGLKIIDKFKYWQQKNLLNLLYDNESYRCSQVIANLADSIFPEENKTVSKNLEKTEHDGIFMVAKSRLQEYMTQYDPQVLRFSRTTDNLGYPALNFGESKGMTFRRVIIFPNGKASSWIKSGDIKHIAASAAKMYVAATRARFSVAFLYDGDFNISDAVRW